METADAQVPSSAAPRGRRSGTAAAIAAAAPWPDHPLAPDEAALARASDAIIELDASLRVAMWNHAAERLYGIAVAEMIGRPLTDQVACHPAGQARAQQASPFAGIGLIDGPGTHVVRGRKIPVRVSLIPFWSTQGPERCLAIVRDESEQVRLAASLEERLKFEVLLSEISARFNNVPAEQVDGEIELWLRRLVEALGVDRGTFSEVTPDGGLSVTHAYARPGIEPYPRGPAQAALPWLVQQFRNRRPVVLSRIPDDVPEHAVAERNYFTTVGLKAGIGIPISVGGSLVCVLTFGKMGEPHEWLMDVISRLHLAGDAFANAIARREAKRRLEQKQNELAHVGRVAALGELASVIAHELDQPLTAMVSNAQAVRHLLTDEEPDLAEADDALEDIIDSAMRVSEIVQRERRLIRKSPVSIGPVDLNETVRDIELFIRADAAQDGARLQLELLPGLPVVRGDRVQLQQVILNLAHNGLQAMRDQPRDRRQLIIRTALSREEVTLSVTDAGPPVDDVLLERMFEPFYTTKANGLGMGLAISKSILDAHHGRIWATRNPAGGLSVHVAIPRK